MSSENRGDILVTGIGNSIFYLPNPQPEVKSEAKKDLDKLENLPWYSLQEPVSSSEKFHFSDPVEVASSPTIALNIVDCASSLHNFTGSRDSFASIASQDVNSLQRKMVSNLV